MALGRAILWTTVGTVLGGLVGFGLTRVVGADMMLLGPLAGFGIAAFQLWTETTELGRRRRLSKDAARPAGISFDGGDYAFLVCRMTLAPTTGVS